MAVTAVISFTLAPDEGISQSGPLLPLSLGWSTARPENRTDEEEGGNNFRGRDEDLWSNASRSVTVVYHKLRFV